jgi:hypothetical protein
MHRGADIDMGEMLGRSRKAAKIPDLTARDIRDAQQTLGHHSAAFTLQVYRKPVSAWQQKAVDELDSRLKVVPIREGVA